jgi:hypothetical protein
VVVVLLALAAVVRTLYGWYHWHAQLMPDTWLYVQGGIGLFPSPLGRLIGSFGPNALAWVSALSTGAIVLLAAAIADELHGRRTLAAALAFCAPLGIWTIFAGVDALACALLLAGVWLLLRNGWRHALACFTAAVLAHPAALPVVAALFWTRRTWHYSLAAGAIGVLALALTPYNGIVEGLNHPLGFLRAGGATVAIAAATMAPLIYWTRHRTRLTRALNAFAVGTFLAAGFAGAAEGVHSVARYALPLVMLACAVACAAPARRDPETA